jgi:hypothetical protein
MLAADELTAATNRALQGTGRTASDPVTILEAARHGQGGDAGLPVDAPGWKHDAEVAPVVDVADRKVICSIAPPVTPCAVAGSCTPFRRPGCRPKIRSPRRCGTEHR